jgi:TetR/AcrR family transcriptional regulator
MDNERSAPRRDRERKGKSMKMPPISARRAGKKVQTDKPKPAATPVKATRRQKATEARTEQVLNAALELFSTYGFRGTSLDQIAERADISKTNLLYYFESKKALYDGVLSRLIDMWLAPLKLFDEASDPIDAIDNYIQAKLEYSRDHPLASKLFCLGVVQGDGLPEEHFNDELRALVDSKAHIIRTWIDEGHMADIEPHHILFSIWAITQHYADFATQVEALTGRTLADPEFFDETVANVRRLLLNGLQIRGRQ